MHRSVVSLVAGVLVIVSTIAVDQHQRTGHAEDVRGIANLRRSLDSTRALLVSATTAADSLRIADAVKEREYYLSRREFHVPLRQEQLDSFWTPGGRGTIFIACGAGLIILGVVLLRLPRSRSA